MINIMWSKIKVKQEEKQEEKVGATVLVTKCESCGGKAIYIRKVVEDKVLRLIQCTSSDCNHMERKYDKR